MINKTFNLKNLIVGIGVVATSAAMNANTITTDVVSPGEDKITVATAQEAGDINWKQWSVLIPLDSGHGMSTLLSGKTLKKKRNDSAVKKFFKQNSNNTYELKARFTGITEDGEFGPNQGKYSASELVEIYNPKGGGDKYWSNKGSHILKSRMKAYKANGISTTYMSRIVSIDKDGHEFDKIRIMWRDGYILAESYETYNGGARYKRTKIAEVGENNFNFQLKMTNGNVTLSIRCKNTGADVKNEAIASFNKSATTKNLFRIGNYYKNDKNSEDSVVVQLKYVTLSHKS